MVDPSMLYRRRPDHDTEDLACTFLEEEVGRFDWIRNWESLRKDGIAHQKVKSWLDFMGIEHDPGAIVDYLNNLSRTRPGRWH